MARSSRFTLQAYLLRLFLAALVVFGTYNPSGYSFFHWFFMATNFSDVFSGNIETMFILKVFTLVALSIGWVVYIRATSSSLGIIGTLMTVAFFVLLFWLMVDVGLLGNSSEWIQYIALVIASFVLATGMSWSHIKRRLSGQIDVDDVED